MSNSHLYEKLVKRATLSAVLISIVLIIIKLLTCWLTGSISLLASLLDSSIDLLASGLNFFLVRYALKPADDDHTFGHGKAESLAALAQSTFIIGSATIVLLSSVKSVISPSEIQVPLLGIIISIISTVITAFLVLYQKYVIKLTRSKAIEADMLHYSSDMLMNIAVIFALALSWYGVAYADAFFAFFIALYICYSAYQIAYNAIQDLLDRALPDSDNAKIAEIIAAYPDVRGFHDLKTRQAGPLKFIQLHLELDDDMPLIQAHAIADSVEKRISEEFSPATVIIHQDPISVVPIEMMQ
ncbi:MULTISPECIES: cation diffusion facilitator family transporter [unclassified Gilliamella]|uniref:cation diffusion facilitator family transporter n=1 Tax=unclassified Gilliamella TaxID=2685620 RepID=UPI002269E3BE|nr:MULTISPECIES: cation diffusion facilitator family transporter [unclassified Gilliamella]MCX8640863.1 cation diffusion facilitator family transporter [Gilliamella sp. B3835]MCX8707802.1 cation diffusion facilitator family transporter [Gilliamella sp. B3783]MCX8709267.1 cation diffusion facilitator family transporter [Gilliamella sp. B3780]MCX8713394.1 cation diffusion facilitator family transporter [Gilliamella sp. B3781]MCX8716785.1 cation diffusion facilitator family transporter [Gilliamel